MKITSVNLPDNLHEILKERASFNHRSLTGEIVYLIEVGLSVKGETAKEMMFLVDQLLRRVEDKPT
jgi:plasmid stability protein